MATSSSSIGGLVSGLDSKTLISQLMQVAALPQTRLKTQLSSTNAQVTAAQSVNAKGASLTTLAKELVQTKTYTTASATSSSDRVTASVTGTPEPASISFEVLQRAQAASVSIGPLTDDGDLDTAGVQFQLVTRGTTFPISASSGSLADVATAINGTKDIGVRARIVTGGADGPQLVITSTTTGSDTGITLRYKEPDGDGDHAIPAKPLVVGRNAEIDLGGGTVISSSTDTFKGLIDGVDVTLKAGAADYDTGIVTVSTAVTPGGISSKVSSLVASMNAVLSDLAFHTKAPATGTTASATNGGLLAGDATFRSLTNSLINTVSTSSAAVSAGLSVGRDGTVSFDAATFEALYKNDPEKAQAALTTFATAVQGVGSAASDSVSGSVTAFITGSKSTATTLTDRIADYDVRLDAKQARLTAQYAALETALQKLKSQSDSLTSALAALTANNSN